MEIGVLTPVQQSQYGTSAFILPKKEGTVRFIAYYFKIKHKLLRKTYTLPRIVKTMQKLEIFQYAAALDINMGCYTIRLSLAMQDMTTIVTGFGKFRYNCLLMIMCALGGIFQAKVDELLSDIKVVKTYIDDILVLI